MQPEKKKAKRPGSKGAKTGVKGEGKTGAKPAVAKVAAEKDDALASTEAKKQTSAPLEAHEAHETEEPAEPTEPTEPTVAAAPRSKRAGSAATATATATSAARDVRPEADDDAPPPSAAAGGEPFALMGYFETPADLYTACEALRDAGYEHFDAHTPFPVHGLERAMGLKPSRLPWIVLGGGIFGLGGAVLLCWYTQAFEYPLNISGKPSFALPAFIPIIFELTILLSAFATFFGMWGMNKLPTHYHPTLTHPSFPRATDDAFFVSVEVRDDRYDPVETRELLEELGAQEVAEVMA